jgi:predicted metal-dependent hydrolase
MPNPWPGRAAGPAGRHGSADELTIGGQKLAVTLRRHAGARRIVLRVDRTGSGIAITLPLRASRKSALDFARSQQDWIMNRIQSPPSPAREGDCLPVRGIAHKIVHEPSTRGNIRLAGGPGDHDRRVIVTGERVHFERRLRDWLKSEARRDLAAAARAYAARLGVKIRRITLRDPSSRWGSCSQSGDLSFSWRLIMAPPFVLDYVAAHEVAHLVHMNHGPDFWSLVRAVCARSGEARAWLRRRGHSLHRCGL